LFRNESYFAQPLRHLTYLEARGFDREGKRSGGIVAPAEITIPAGAILVRFYHDPSKKIGGWWNTTHELAAIITYFARSGPALATGRAQGKGVVHASLVVRHDWADNHPLHLGLFFVVQLRTALKAFHGEGDHAPDASQQQTQKAVLIMGTDNRQRPARQVFLPKAREYADAFRELHEGHTDADLERALARFGSAPLPFEK
jgi:hypothetical protein